MKKLNKKQTLQIENKIQKLQKLNILATTPEYVQIKKSKGWDANKIYRSSRELKDFLNNKISNLKYLVESKKIEIDANFSYLRENNMD